MRGERANLEMEQLPHLVWGRDLEGPKYFHTNGAWKINISAPSLFLKFLVSIGKPQLEIQPEGKGAIDVVQISRPPGTQSTWRRVESRSGGANRYPAGDY